MKLKTLRRSRPGLSRWAMNPMARVLKRDRRGDRRRGRPRGVGGRGRSDAATSQGAPGPAELEGAGKAAPGASRGSRPASTWLRDVAAGRGCGTAASGTEGDWISIVLSRPACEHSSRQPQENSMWGGEFHGLVSCFSGRITALAPRTHITGSRV